MSHAKCRFAKEYVFVKCCFPLVLGLLQCLNNLLSFKIGRSQVYVLMTDESVFYQASEVDEVDETLQFEVIADICII